MLIYIAEDDENISELISYCLKNASYEVVAFCEGKKLLKEIETNSPDICILDIMLPDISGMTVLEQIRKRGFNTPIIMLTAKTDEINKIKAFELGADDYITKPFSIMEMVARVKAILRRSQKTEHGIQYKFDDIIFNVKEMQVYKNGQKIKLTNKECALLKCLFENNKIVLSRERLLELVWGYDFVGTTTRTVDMHIKSLRKKLSGKLVQTIRGSGYMLGGEND